MKPLRGADSLLRTAFMLGLALATAGCWGPQTFPVTLSVLNETTSMVNGTVFLEYTAPPREDKSPLSVQQSYPFSVAGHGFETLGRLEMGRAEGTMKAKAVLSNGTITTHTWNDFAYEGIDLFLDGRVAFDVSAT